MEIRNVSGAGEVLHHGFIRPLDELLSDEIAKLRTEISQIDAAQAESASNLNQMVPAEEIAEYKLVCAHLNFLQGRQNDYLQQGYTDEYKLVKQLQEQMAAATKIKSQLEDKFPVLANLNTTLRRVAALALRIKELEAQLVELQSEAAKLEGKRSEPPAPSK